MAGASLFTLIDDIASILDDVSVMTKVAAKKTAGVLGDDLALNAQQVTGIRADRELPVVWAVAKGSALNKVILVPIALLISALLPAAVIPLLMLGGLFLCFEGVEKLAHQFFNLRTHENKGDEASKISDSELSANQSTIEASKIQGAIRTDFVLSAEIIVITLGTVATATFLNQVLVLVGIAAIMTIGVYGLVAGIVKLDDAGLYLSRSQGQYVFAQLKRRVGFALLSFAPYMMKTLSVVGTIAMFLVGGAILAHGIPAVHHAISALASAVPNNFFRIIVTMLLEGLFGVMCGVLALLVFNIAKPKFDKFSKRFKKPMSA